MVFGSCMKLDEVVDLDCYGDTQIVRGMKEKHERSVARYHSRSTRAQKRYLPRWKRNGRLRVRRNRRDRRSYD